MGYDARAPFCPHCKEPPDLLPMTVEEWQRGEETYQLIYNEQ
ncbi:MAG: hypothetical protein AAGA81_13665 [Acidobacteriota bacterium]